MQFQKLKYNVGDCVLVSTATQCAMFLKSIRFIKHCAVTGYWFSLLKNSRVLDLTSFMSKFNTLWPRTGIETTLDGFPHAVILINY